MNAKEYLGQAYRLDQHINDRLMQLSQLRALTQRITTACDGEVVSRTRNVHALEDSVIRLMEAEQEYVEAERQYSDLRNQVCSLLQRLDDPMNADILRLRYVEHKRMPAIAKELHLSRSSIYSRHEIALSELQGILQTQST